MSTAHAYCICTTAAEKAIKSLLEGSGAGNYRVTDPWLIAAEELARAREADERLAIFFASGEPLEFSHWAWIESVEVVELHRGSFETRCEFSPLQPVNPIWAPIDSLLIKPAEYQLAREAREGLRQHRHAVTAQELHPYAICETPAFVCELAR